MAALRKIDEKAIKTTQRFIIGDASGMDELGDASIDLVVTSPPYPMIEMWDEILSAQDARIAKALAQNNGAQAFEWMHQILDGVWRELFRVVKPGGIVCINIGDATRSLGGEFELYSNHSRIVQAFLKLGFSNLPNILWRKQTNAPNKFMGSGMYPPGAYVTLEHEYILVFRKGGKRVFKSVPEKLNRRRSAYFWEERNVWFSDVWDFKGVRQALANSFEKDLRERSAAFPFELAYRLINMFSVKNDLVLDPFLGTGTTLFAAAASCRNAVGYDLDEGLTAQIPKALTEQTVAALNKRIERRFQEHHAFVEKRTQEKGEHAFKYRSECYDFPLMTRQEREIFIHFLKNIRSQTEGVFEASYHDTPAQSATRQKTLF